MLHLKICGILDLTESGYILKKHQCPTALSTLCLPDIISDWKAKITYTYTSVSYICLIKSYAILG